MKNPKNTYKKKIICMIAAVGMTAAAGCGLAETTSSRIIGTGSDIRRENSVTSQRRYEESVQSAGEPGEIAAAGLQIQPQMHPVSSSMGSVPYFRDDAGKRAQAVDCYLYSYWNNRLCRYDRDTLEETVLYEAASSQSGSFCIWREYVYFIVVPNVNSVGKIHGYLYRVRCDGTEEAVCLTSVKMPGQYDRGDYYRDFILDTYEDVLYLVGQRDDTENLYFRLNQDGSISRISESETLYGQLPEGYSGWRAANQIITLPYAMRNYGYVFITDEDDNLVRMDLESGEMESIGLHDGHQSYNIAVITNDSVVARGSVRGSEDNWYRASLDDIDETEEIGYVAGSSSFGFWDEDGIYFIKKSEDRATLTFMNWEGELVTLNNNFVRLAYSGADWREISYFDGDYYYYIASVNGDEEVRRLELKEDAEPEKVADYYINPYRSITTRERFNYDWTDEYLHNRVAYEITEVHFTEDTAAFRRINAFLDDLYAEAIAATERSRDGLKEEYDWEYYEKWGPDFLEFSDAANVSFIDENYVGICMDWYYYTQGAAHGMYGSVYYMFDRHTGERLYITDMVNNSPQEICDIIAPYVEAAASWGIDEEGWEADILEEGRFFLTKEGIGIHFDVYEIDSYAAGEREIIVPYSVFDMKEAVLR